MVQRSEHAERPDDLVVLDVQEDAGKDMYDCTPSKLDIVAGTVEVHPVVQWCD